MEDKFIDADTPHSKEGNTFQDILNRQIRKTSDALSHELDIGITMDQENKKAYQEDRREIAINHVKTTKSLMGPFIKGDHETKLEDLDKQIQEFREELGDQEMEVYGEDNVKISSVIHDKRSKPFAILQNFRVKVHRAIFDILILIYHRHKQEILAFSSE